MEELDRVRSHTDDRVNTELDDQRLLDVAGYVGATPAMITHRLEELDREWDIERMLETNAAGLTLISTVLAAAHSKRWLLLGALVPAFLLQHAIQGWCPPLEVLRRIGIRTRREIDAERTALKALRGDFDGVSTAAETDGEIAAAGLALEAVGRR